MAARPSVGQMRTYLVEQYLPGIAAAQLEDANARLAAAAKELAAHGVQVRYLGSTFVPEDESCFCTFESGDANDVRRACEQAGVAFARILETHDLVPGREGK
jgi:hypothetical protein